MARITVEDCLGNVENRFELVMVATKRARQIATGGKDPLVKEDSDKATVISLREIAEGLVTPDILNKVQPQEEDAFEIEEPAEDEAEDLDISALAEALAKEVEAAPGEEQE